jgi:hypothetical protein
MVPVESCLVNVSGVARWGINAMQRSNQSPDPRTCRDCRFLGPSGACLDPVLEKGQKSGRCGDWIWYVRGSKQVRRRYAKPNDPRTRKQRLWRARFAAASRKYSHSLTDEQQDACIATGAKLKCRPRLGLSGYLTGQQYSIRKELAAQAAARARKAKDTTQVPQLQRLKRIDVSQVGQPQGSTRSTSGPHRGRTTSTPERHKHNPWRAGENQGRSSQKEGARKPEETASQVQQNQTFTLSTWAHQPRMSGATPSRIGPGTRRPAGGGPMAVARPQQVYYTSCMKSNVITVRLRRPKAEIQVKAKPNLNAWINQLIEQALGPRSADGSAQKATKAAKPRVARTSPAKLVRVVQDKSRRKR